MSDEKKKLRSPYFTDEDWEAYNREVAASHRALVEREAAAHAEFVKKYGVCGRRTPEQEAACAKLLSEDGYGDELPECDLYELLADAYIDGTVYAILGDLTKIDFDRVKSIVKARGYDV